MTPLAGNDAPERACFADIFTYIPDGVGAFCAPIEAARAFDDGAVLPATDGIQAGLSTFCLLCGQAEGNPCCPGDVVGDICISNAGAFSCQDTGKTYLECVTCGYKGGKCCKCCKTGAHRCAASISARLSCRCWM